MSGVVADIETDGLLDDLTRIHSLVLRDNDTGAVIASCTDDSPNYRPIRYGLDLLRKADRVYGHNFIGFDIPAIRKIYPRWSIEKPKVRDTFIAAQLWKADISPHDWPLVRRKTFPAGLIGSHKLEAWGYRLGLQKGEYTTWCEQNGIADPWAQWRPEMQSYCELDTKVNHALVRLLATKKIAPDALNTEMRLAWFLEAMERNGFPLNVPECERLNAVLSGKLAGLEAELRQVFQPWVVEVGPFTPKRNDRTKGYVAGCPATKIKFVEFKPSSRDHIVNRLQALYGWEPTEFNDPTPTSPEGNPKMDDEIVKALPYPEAPKLAEYLLVNKRLGQLANGKQAWMKMMKNTGPWGGKLTGMFHVHGRINQLGAVTHRATHSSPNMSQVPKVAADKEGNLKWGTDSDYSTDFRNVWTVPDGWLLIGADASGLELRCLAHYMAKYDGGAYGEIILNGRNEDGTDIHSMNRDALGLSGKEGREIAKTFIYAYLYGAGDQKLGSILEPQSSPERQKKLGAQLRAKFESGFPALGRLVEDVKQRSKDQGYLVVLDGRRIMVRAEHSALNSLLQAAGAVICKTWLALSAERLEAEFGEQGWDKLWAALIWSHDEKQTAVRPHIAPRVKEIVVDSIRHMTTHFAFRCPLDGEAKIGRTWAETH